MFRRIFGIGKKREVSIYNTNMDESPVLLKDGTFDSQTNTSFMTLHSASAAIKSKKEPAEVLNEAVNRLVEKLERINDNLDQQISQNQRLVQRMDVLPDVLTSLPKAIEEHRQAFAHVAEQLEQKNHRDEKVAEELVGIHEKVASSAQASSRMSENFLVFADTLSKLDQNTENQTDWIRQLSSAFSTSEQYFKYSLEKQQKQFYWILGISLGVCLFTVMGLIIGIALLT